MRLDRILGSRREIEAAVGRVLPPRGDGELPFRMILQSPRDLDATPGRVPPSGGEIELSFGAKRRLYGALDSSLSEIPCKR